MERSSFAKGGIVKHNEYAHNRANSKCLLPTLLSKQWQVWEGGEECSPQSIPKHTFTIVSLATLNVTEQLYLNLTKSDAYVCVCVCVCVPVIRLEQQPCKYVAKPRSRAFLPAAFYGGIVFESRYAKSTNSRYARVPIQDMLRVPIQGTNSCSMLM